MSLSRGALDALKLGQGGTYSLSRDALKHQVWDTRFFTAATVDDHTFFVQPIGAPWRAGIKTINETNLADSGKLPNGQTFLAVRMGIALISAFPYTGTDAADVAQAFINLVQSSVFEIRIAGREFDFQIHGRQFLPALAINGDNGSVIASTHRVGDLIASGWINLNPAPIFLDQLVSFNVNQRMQNPDPAVAAVLAADATILAGYYSTMQVTLEGFLTRAK